MIKALKLLVALDHLGGRELLSESVLLARCCNGRLWLLHMAAPDPDFVGLDAGSQPVRDSRARELCFEHERLQTRADEVRAQKVDCSALLIQDPTGEAILEQADRLDID